MSAINTNPTGSGTIVWAHGNSNGEAIDAWHPSLQADENLNDSDKSLTVPASTEWQVLSIWVELTSDGTAGNRQMTIEFQDNAADVIGQVRAGAVQAASLTRYYVFSSQVADLTSFRDTDFLMTPLPPLILPAAYIVRVYDSAAIAAATDDMIVQMLVLARGNII